MSSIVLKNQLHKDLLNYILSKKNAWESTLLLLKSFIPSFKGNILTSISEGDMKEEWDNLKKGNIPDEYSLIIKEIEDKFPIEEIDFITTPDKNTTHISKLLDSIGKRFHLEVKYPQVTKEVSLTKEQDYKAKIEAAEGMFEMSKDNVKGKNVFILVDILGNCAKLISLLEELNNKGANVFVYSILNVREDI